MTTYQDLPEVFEYLLGISADDPALCLPLEEFYRTYLTVRPDAEVGTPERLLAQAIQLDLRHAKPNCLDYSSPLRQEDRWIYFTATAHWKHSSAIPWEMLFYTPYARTMCSVSGDTPLMYACANGRTEAALWILEGECNSDAVNAEGQTALIKACLTRHTAVALQLCDTDSIPQQVDDRGNTALILACKNGMKSVALRLIDTRMCSSQQSDDSGNTALMYACMNGSMKYVALRLLDMDCCPAQTNERGDTALILACEQGMEGVAYWLLDTDCKPFHRNRRGQSAVLYACENGMEHVATKLVDMISPDFLVYWGDLLLRGACKSGMEAVALRLIEKGICANATLCTAEAAREHGMTRVLRALDAL